MTGKTAHDMRQAASGPDQRVHDCHGPGSTHTHTHTHTQKSSQWPTCLFLDLAEHTEESRLHPMAIQGMLSERETTEESVRERRVILFREVKMFHIDPASSVENCSYEVTLQKHFL